MEQEMKREGSNIAWEIRDLYSRASSSSARVVVSSPRRDWSREVTCKLNELTALRRGWDGHRAKPVSFDTAHFALKMLESICREEAPAPQIVPGTGGDLQIEWHTDHGDLELHVLSPNNVRAWFAPIDDAEGSETALTNDFTEVARWVHELTEPAFAGAAAA